MRTATVQVALLSLQKFSGWFLTALMATGQSRLVSNDAENSVVFGFRTKLTNFEAHTQSLLVSKARELGYIIDRWRKQVLHHDIACERRRWFQHAVTNHYFHCSRKPDFKSDTHSRDIQALYMWTAFLDKPVMLWYFSDSPTAVGDRYLSSLDHNSSTHHHCTQNICACSECGPANFAGHPSCYGWKYLRWLWNRVE